MIFFLVTNIQTAEIMISPINEKHFFEVEKCSRSENHFLNDHISQERMFSQINYYFCTKNQTAEK